MRLDSFSIPLKERNSMMFIQYGEISVKNGAFVLIRDNIQTTIPIGGIACIFIEPGTTITHDAIKLASETGTLLVWTGEEGVNIYSVGMPGGSSSDHLLYQAKLALDNQLRAKVVRKMYKFRFNDDPPEKRSIEQLRGMEGIKVKAIYESLAQQYKVAWSGREYSFNNWNSSDPINKAISAANHALYGICEIAILASGYSPAIGFMHTGNPRSFVFDIADLYKFETVIPVAFQTIGAGSINISREIRLKCRDAFKESKILEKIIPTIEEMLKVDYDNNSN